MAKKMGLLFLSFVVWNYISINQRKSLLVFNNKIFVKKLIDESVHGVTIPLAFIPSVVSHTRGIGALAGVISCEVKK